MADAFERELEELVSRVARELARDITSVILRRLGIESAARAVSSAPKSKAARRIGRLVPSHPPATKPVRASKPEATKRTRASASERADQIERVARTVDQSDGLSSGEIERKAKLSRNVVQAAIKALKDQGRVFMGGTKRFARYAASQAQADRASESAHN